MPRTATAQPRFRVSPGFEAEYSDSSPLATECVLNMGYVCHRFTAYIERVVRDHGIPSLAAFNVLTVLSTAPQPLPPSVIADRMVVTRGTITTIVDSLERRGLVRRLSNAASRTNARRPRANASTHEGHDGRVRPIQLTPRGAARAEAVEAALHPAERQFMDALSPTQQRALLHMLAALQANLPAPTAPERAQEPRPAVQSRTISESPREERRGR